MVERAAGDTAGWQARGSNGWGPWKISIPNCPVYLVMVTIMIEHIIEGMLDYDLIKENP